MTNIVYCKLSFGILYDHPDVCEVADVTVLGVRVKSLHIVWAYVENTACCVDLVCTLDHSV